MKKSDARLVSTDLWEVVKQVPRNGMPTLAAIAYYSRDLLTLMAGDELVCDASDATIASGSSSGRLLLALHRKGVKVYNQPTLHAKVACIGGYVIIGSGNASENSQRNLIEAAVVSCDSALRAQAMALVRTLATKKAVLEEEELKRLAAIKVVRQGRTKPRRPQMKLAHESATWWLGTRPLSKRAVEAQKPQMDLGLKAAKRLARDVRAEDLECIRWPMSARVAREVQPGDRVIQAFATPRGNERNCKVYAPAAVVHIERSKRTAIIFLRYLQADWEPVTIGKVRSTLKKSSGRKLTARSARGLSKIEFAAIENLY